MAGSQDPYFVARDEIISSVRGVSELFARWTTLLNTTNTASNEEFRWTQNEMKTILKSIQWDLGDLEETVQIVEKNRAKFDVGDDELARRKQFVHETKATIAEINKTLNSADTKAKLAADERKTLSKASGKAKAKQRAADRQAKMSAAIEADNEEYIGAEKKQQEQALAEQEADLTELQATVGTLGQIGLTINQEIEAQSKILDEFHDEVDDTQSRMRSAISKVDKILEETSDGKLTCVIVSLIVVLVIVTILAFVVGFQG
mmetsp:Transcript_55493/g.136113  ORF Transcript_55493/g.136113 Transcript_55493/m.136113 type:complete len:261 (-) Transcript_55493:478-1260(-)